MLPRLVCFNVSENSQIFGLLIQRFQPPFRTDSMQVRFNIWRQTLGQPPRFQPFTLDVEAGQTILDCLNRIKWEQDGTLAFRKNCRNTICGSCAMRINGRATLACKENIGGELVRLEQIAATRYLETTKNAVGDEVENSCEVVTPDPLAEMTGIEPNTLISNAIATSSKAGEVGGIAREQDIPEMTIAPLGNMPVLKDLIVDTQNFWDHLEAVDPYVRGAERSLAERESLQTPVERAALNQMGNCILCGACYSECNALELNPDFVGPHALAKVHRLLVDSRDQATPARLEQANSVAQGVWACTRCSYCNVVCPMEVAPLDQISKIKGAILQQSEQLGGADSRAIRHRRSLVALVKQGGWIDERLFGLRVVSNYLRDVPGTLSLLPLGWRMVKAGKFPVSFERSEGTAQVRSLIEAVQGLDPSQRVADTVSHTPEPVGG